MDWRCASSGRVPHEALSSNPSPTKNKQTNKTKLLHIKGNNYQNQETPHKMGETLCKYSMDKGLISRMYKELKKIEHQKNK
jgi:hypothetical protein